MRQSKIPTPFAVNCREGCGSRLYLTEEEYDRQLDNPNRLWQCPRCGGTAIWDDENYEEHMKKLEDEEPEEKHYTYLCPQCKVNNTTEDVCDTCNHENISRDINESD